MKTKLKNGTLVVAVEKQHLQKMILDDRDIKDAAGNCASLSKLVKECSKRVAAIRTWWQVE